MANLLRLVAGVLAASLALSGLASERAGPAEVEALCRTSLCRSPGTVTVRLRDGKMFETSFSSPSPIVNGGSAITIFPGEEHFIEVDVSEGKVLELTAVRSIKHPERTLKLRMWQEPSKADTFLVVTNPLSVTLKYHAVMMSTESEALYKTSSCAVPNNGRSAYEHWPHEIFQLVLFDFRVVSNEGVSCEF